MFGWLKQRLTGAKPTAVEPDIPLDLSRIPGAFRHSDDLPRPQWKIIAAAIDALPPTVSRSAAWAEAERQWLDELCDALGPPYAWIESGPVLMVAACEAAEAGPFARMAAGALAIIDDVLGEPAVALKGKLVVLALCPAETYYTYISHYYADGEYGGSGGACLSEDGHLHIAFIHVGDDVERVLMHEMVHVRLHGADLPLWLEEGLAEMLSRRVARAQPLQLAPADVRRQQHWWGKHGLQSFWEGTSFSRNNRGQAFSYHLAEIMVSTMIADHSKRFRAFLSDASSKDAGDAASRKHLGISIADWAERFLGEGDWAYTPRSDPTGAIDPDA